MLILSESHTNDGKSWEKPVNSINTGMITPGKIPLCLGEAKMAATTINVVNSFSTIFPSYLLFFKKTASKTRL